MTISRRSLVKLSLQAGALPLLDVGILHAAGPDEMVSDTGPRGRTMALQVRSLPLDKVRITGGPLKTAQDADIKYLLSLEPDRMLAYFRKRAGLVPKAEPCTGWDGDGRNLTGHVAGHYLSAVSYMWAATGDRRFRDRADYIVQELAAVQNKHGDGYLCALANGRRCFDMLKRGEIKSAAFDLNGEWSPWYTLHKTFAGLRDAYRYAGNRTALNVEAKFAGWAGGVLASLTPAQIQQMLGTEFGGMNEVLVDLYADTGNKRWLDLSYKFEHAKFVEPLQRHEDDIGGTHANTDIPKILGSAHRFAYVGKPADLMAASFFYDSVVQHHGFATGGHGTDEYFGPPDRIGARVDGRTAESCNVYNMLKFSRLMFGLNPDAHYADYHERALFNHALASFDTDTGRMCYMVPVGRGVTHEYQDMERGFTCCVCTGMENHALHGEGIWFENGDTLWLNQFVPSTAEWSSAGARLTMETNFPVGDSATVKLALKSARAFTLAVRRPYWVGDGFAVKVNGEELPAAGPVTSSYAGSNTSSYDRPVMASPSAGRFVQISRTWRSGDTVEISLPKTLRLEPTPDDPRRTAIMWGPLVLAADLGPEPTPRRDEDGGQEVSVKPEAAPIFVAANRPVSEWLRASGQSGRFHTQGVGRTPDATGAAHDVDLVPFYTLQRRTYSTYFDLATPDEWAAQKADYEREAERMRRLEAATVAFVQPGEQSSEKNFNYLAGTGVFSTRVSRRSARTGRSWFSYDIPVDGTHPMALVVTYFTADRRTSPAAFELLVDGKHLADQNVDRTDPARFYDVSYQIPPELVRDRSNVTVRFQAKDKSQIAAVFGVRMVRADQEP